MLNLLPPKVKKEQKINQIADQVSVALIAFVLMTGLSYAAIFLVNYSLGAQVEKNNRQLDLVTTEIAKLSSIEDDVSDINKKISKIDQLQNQRIEWSEFFKDFNDAIPTTVKINSVSISEKKDFNITAAAETRADITKLQGQLESLPNLKELKFSSSTYVGGESNYFTFSMTGTVTNEETKE